MKDFTSAGPRVQEEEPAAKPLVETPVPASVPTPIRSYVPGGSPLAATTSFVPPLATTASFQFNRAAASTVSFGQRYTQAPQQSMTQLSQPLPQSVLVRDTPKHH